MTTEQNWDNRSIPRGPLKTWLLATLLALPAFAPLVAHYIGFVRVGLWPTGFLIYDTPYYMANAREHFDAGGFSFAYSSPFSYDYASPRIYFQPLTLLLGLLTRLPGADPGIVFALVGLAAAIVCSRVAIAVFDRFASRSTSSGRLALFAFFWGGGLFVVMGTFFAFLPGTPGSTGQLFNLSAWWWFTRVADPVGGWWFLNFGRNFVLSTEAAYHGMVFGTVLLILTRRFAPALGVMALLAISHPFTGIQFLAVVSAWAALELIILRSRVVPWWFAAGAVALAALHVAYYLLFLPRFPEHRQLQEQWTLHWTLTFPQSVIAYGIVAAFAIARIRSRDRAREVVSQWPNRLLIVWVLVCLALENHELFLPRAIQPIHFTRGYSWIGLFLLGVPTLVSAFDRLLKRGDAKPKVFAAAGLVFFLVVDNAVWVGANSAQAVGIQLGRKLPADSLTLGFGLTDDQRNLFDWLSEPRNRGKVVLSEDETVGYLLTVYTPLRSWRSHYANTPWNRPRLNELRAFFQSGTVVDAWRRLPMLVVFRDSTNWRRRTAGFAPLSPEPVYVNASYAVVSVPGSASGATASEGPPFPATSVGTPGQGARATSAPDPR